MKTKEGSAAHARNRGAGRDKADELARPAMTLLPLAFHFQGAGTLLAGLALLVALVGTAFLNASAAGVVGHVGHVSMQPAPESTPLRFLVSLAAPVVLGGHILVVLGALFAARRGDVHHPTLRYGTARLGAAFWGLCLALLLTRIPLGAWLAEHVTWAGTALRVLRWSLTFVAVGSSFLVVRANLRELSVPWGLRLLRIALGLFAGQILVAAFHNTLFVALWNSRLRVFHGSLELAGSLGFILAGTGLFLVARSMHHAWIEGHEGVGRPT